MDINSNFLHRFLPIPLTQCGLRAYDILRILQSSMVSSGKAKSKTMQYLLHCPFNPYIASVRSASSPTSVLRLVYCYVRFPRAFSIISGASHSHTFGNRLYDPHGCSSVRKRLRLQPFENMVNRTLRLFVIFLLLSLIACIGACWWIPNPFVPSASTHSTATLTLTMTLVGFLLPLTFQVRSRSVTARMSSSSFLYIVPLVVFVFILHRNAQLSLFDFLTGVTGSCMLLFLLPIAPGAYQMLRYHHGMLLLMVIAVVCVFIPLRNASNLIVPLAAHLAMQLLARSCYIQDLRALGFPSLALWPSNSMDDEMGYSANPCPHSDPVHDEQLAATIYGPQ